MDDVTKVSSRSSTDIVGLLGTYGGTWDFLKTVSGFFISSFASMNYASLIANRFYTWNAPTSFKEDGYFANEVNYVTEVDSKKKEEIPIPPFLAVWQCCFTFLRCFCKLRRFRDYKDTIKIVEKDMSRNLDILDLLRRLKMHGFALTSQLSKSSMRFISGRLVS